jgi:hypothetical protein
MKSSRFGNIEVIIEPNKGAQAPHQQPQLATKTGVASSTQAPQSPIGPHFLLVGSIETGLCIIDKAHAFVVAVSLANLRKAVSTF